MTHVLVGAGRTGQGSCSWFDDEAPVCDQIDCCVKPEEEGGMRIGVKPGQWGWGFEELRYSWRVAEELGFDVLSCFDPVSAAPSGLVAWDAPSLLVAMAGVTSRITLAVDVVNICLRHPFLLAGQLAVAQATSGGRLRVGLGAGSFQIARFDHQVTLIPFPPFRERLERLRLCCQVLPRLWRGESVEEARLGLQGAGLGPISIDPPVLIVGGAGDHIMEIAARYAAGWNVSLGTADAIEEYPVLARRMSEICLRVGRSGPLENTVQVFLSTINPSQAREVAERLERSGANLVTFVLHQERGSESLMRLADSLHL
jgi:alkanesulfonate monooxygenase SsuD/methylene tetrahydromethanopterin reductase-like flavin-dependent oxidoreductase (luciferase family)